MNGEMTKCEHLWILIEKVDVRLENLTLKGKVILLCSKCLEVRLLKIETRFVEE